jgi:hypothetical protein
MAGKIAGTVLTLMFLTFMVFLISFYFLHMSIKENVNDLNYGVSEVIATSGIFSENLYDYLKDNINKYGDYAITVKLDKQITTGVFNTYFINSNDNDNEIINNKLRVGDRVTIYLEDRKPSLFGRLINAAFMGHKPDNIIDTEVKSIKTAIVSKNSKDLVKGYEVIADIKLRLIDSNITVFVATKLNPAGKFYSSGAHQDVTQVNPVYGDAPDETGNTGVNYIFDNGDFVCETIKYEDGSIRLIKYIQQ